MRKGELHFFLKRLKLLSTFPLICIENSSKTRKAILLLEYSIIFEFTWMRYRYDGVCFW